MHPLRGYAGIDKDVVCRRITHNLSLTPPHQLECVAEVVRSYVTHKYQVNVCDVFQRDR